MNLLRHSTEKAREWMLHAFLFTVPIAYYMGVQDSRVFQERYFQAAVMAFGALFFGNVWLTLFMWLNLWLLLMNNGDVGGSQVLSIFMTGILFTCSRSFFQARSIKPYITTLSIVAILSIVFVGLQALSIDPLHTPVHSDGVIQHGKSTTLQTGLFQLPAFNAVFLALVGALLVMTGSCVGFLLFVPSITARCSASVLALAFLILFRVYWMKGGTGFLFRHRMKILLGAMLACFITYTAIDYKTDKLTYIARFESWHLVARKALERPLFGWGPDSFRNITPSKKFLFQTDESYNPILAHYSENKVRLAYYSADQGKQVERFTGKKPQHLGLWDVCHNEYLQLFFEYGILGVLILIGFFKEIYDRFKLSNKYSETLALFACLAVYALVSLSQFPFHLARLSGIFGVVLGAYFAKTDKNYLMFKEE